MVHVLICPQLQIGYERDQIPHCARDRLLDFSIAYLHSCRNKQGSDHDSSSSHEVREGIYEGSHAKSPQNEVVKEAITRFVQGGSHSAAGKWQGKAYIIFTYFLLWAVPASWHQAYVYEYVQPRQNERREFSQKLENHGGWMTTGHIWPRDERRNTKACIEM